MELFKPSLKMTYIVIEIDQWERTLKELDELRSKLAEAQASLRQQ